MTSAVPLTRGASRDETHVASRYRADIDGLRAPAVLHVVVYHVWFGRVSGGVDVFLMISAYFLTASFLRRLGTGDSMQPFSFWLRRFRRLMPAAAFTISATLLAVFLWYPQSSWAPIWRQAWASLLYFQNVELALNDVDYYTREELVPSPLQHFWSLSIQGQVFVIWPIISLSWASSFDVSHSRRAWWPGESSRWCSRSHWLSPLSRHPPIRVSRTSTRVRACGSSPQDHWLFGIKGVARV